MPKKRFTEERIAFALRQADAGTSVGEICRKMGVAEATFYRWKKVYAGMGVSEIRRLKPLEEENGKLKRLVADLTLDKTMLRGACCDKSSEARPATGGRAPSAGGVRCLGKKSLRRRGLRAGLPPIRLPTRSRGRAADADQRAGGSTRALWLPAAARPAPARRLGREPQEGPQAPPRGRAVDPHADAAAQAGLPVSLGARTAAGGANDVWAMDFVSDKLFDGRAFRILTVVDAHAREALSTATRTNFRAGQVVEELDRLARLRGKPRSIRVDNGPEFAGRRLDQWAYLNKVELDFSRPGKPSDNAFVEAFNSRLRQEGLNASWFLSTADARTRIREWRLRYNNDQPHSSLGGLTPAAFADQLKPAPKGRIRSGPEME